MANREKNSLLNFPPQEVDTTLLLKKHLFSTINNTIDTYECEHVLH